MKNFTSNLFNALLSVVGKQALKTALHFQFYFTKQLRLSQIHHATKNQARHLSKIQKQSSF